MAEGTDASPVLFGDAEIDLLSSIGEVEPFSPSIFPDGDGKSGISGDEGSIVMLYHIGL